MGRLESVQGEVDVQGVDPLGEHAGPLDVDPGRQVVTR
jgi:hypothetical protein